VLFPFSTNGNNFSVIKGFTDWAQLLMEAFIKMMMVIFYGMTSKGGTENAGTIFKMTPSAT
jgi:uncharacterized repeat protein (TIGR03803 family)